MEQNIKNIKAGQKFKIVKMTCGGFDIDCIVEALDDIKNVKKYAGRFKWIAGYEPRSYVYKAVVLTQYVEDLKRFKGKIK